MKRILSLMAAAAVLLWAASAAAQGAKIIKSHQDFGDYRVIYTVFNSSFLKPEIAQQYQLVRADDRAYVNISVVEKGAGKLGLASEISGTATNLIQQSRPLDFREIRDGEAVYYLAPLRFEDEEVLTFKIDLKLPNGRSEQLTFRRQLDKM
ncbi:hypothetical protein Maes01_00849 [Microbulbifer aestuariivivens]|uniref:DUF4426 domain-containing protein n=1 Tax=Microbulbifer aestuariivivens TaxID=1908308 RepID=A0ABP9WMF2_9GAMM